MVHALEQVHRLIGPGGALIDIHPNGEKVEFFGLLEGREHFIGHMQESDDYIEYRQADNAIREVVSKGLYVIENTGALGFRTYADSFDELKTFLKENWSDAVITEDVIARAKALEKEHGAYKAILHEKVTLNLLRLI